MDPPGGGCIDSPLVRAAVRCARGGSAEALQFLYVRFADEVMCGVAEVIGDPEVTQELTRGVFVELKTTIGEFKAGESRFGAWLLDLARRRALARPEARRPAPAGDADPPVEETSLLALVYRDRRSARVPGERVGL